MGAERELDKDATYGIIVVESFHHGDDLLDGGGFGKGDMLEADANLLRGLGLHADIDGGVWTLASLDNGKLGLETRELLLEGGDLVRDSLTDRSEKDVRVTWGRRRKRYFAMRVPSMREDMVMVRKKERGAD